MDALFKPYGYQEKAIQETLNIKGSNVIVLPTGAGKTITSCFLILEWLKKNKDSRVLITCHRIELVEQFIESLNDVGLTTEMIVAGKKQYHYQAKVYVSMVETLNNKLKKDSNFLNDVGLIISDECHVMVHEKVYSNFPNVKIVGLTATPCLIERETYYVCDKCNTEYDELQDCCGIELMEWSRSRKLSNIYEDIVTGITIQELIEMGQLVKEINFTIDIDLSKLKTDAKGEFTNNSLTETYANEEAVYDVVKNYEEIALGKRTMIFNANTKVNKEVYEMFLEKGYNVRMYDSVNTPTLNRKELVKWYAENNDAILCNVASFVAGFDNREIECVILNMATQSLSKYIQCVGRGGRSSKKIYKDSFIVIDLGGNVSRFGEWSSDSVDWVDVFFNGLSKPKAKQESIEYVKECKGCGALIPKNLQSCDICNTETDKPKKREKVLQDEIAKVLTLPNPPNGNKIIKYTINNNKDLSFAIKILHNQMVDMFIYYGVSKKDYEKFKINGKLAKRITEICRPIYFQFVKSGLEYGNNIKLDTFLNKIIKKIDKHYEKNTRE